MDGMNILVSCNDQYMMPLSVLLGSLLENNPGQHVVYFMWADVSEDNRALVERLVEGHGSRVEYVPVGQTEFKGLPTKSYISRETYFRLLAADYLPADVGRILWLDADMAVNGPIDELYQIDFDGASVVACPHGPAMRDTIRENCALLGIEHPEQYFNAGMMLINLDAWRQMDVAGRIAEVLSRPRKMMFPGQDLTNLVFNGSVRTADWRRWNCMTHSIMPADLAELHQEARIIHYVGSAKPWKFTDIPLGDIWMGYYGKSPFAGEPLKRTSYARMRKMYELMQKRGGGA